ncbi:flavin reductase [Daeguia caeni]|uniref:Flavin reductase n=1 Tax=Daeguia caeni TaxID=439612 RepID=A0ABV9HAJ6_9HYPH
MQAAIDVQDQKQAFRNAMAAVPAPVHVITTDGVAGKGGITITAFTAITDEPPTVLVCLNKNSYAASLVLQNKHLAINTLHAEMTECAGRFAGIGKLSMPERFVHTEGWAPLKSGCPTLPEALAVFDCEVHRVEEMGTHYLIFCRVIETQDRSEQPGLLYHNRTYKKAV